MTLHIDSVRGGTSEEAVSSLEQRLNIHLPYDYRQFLVENNVARCARGGVFRDASTRKKLSRADWFLGISDVAHEGIEKNLAALECRIPERLIPVAYDGGGNYLLLDCSERSSGEIRFCFLEYADENDAPSRDSFPLVARSFSELLSMLNEE